MVAFFVEVLSSREQIAADIFLQIELLMGRSRFGETASLSDSFFCSAVDDLPLLCLLSFQSHLSEI